MINQALSTRKTTSAKSKPQAKKHREEDDTSEDVSGDDEKHTGATDEENETSCKTALLWWTKKERFLEFHDRATSAFLADTLSDETFEEEWRRRLKLKPTAKEYLAALVEDMLRRLRLALRIVRLGAPSSMAAYAQRKNLRDTIEAAARLELTIAGAAASQFEKYNATLRKARARNRSKKNEFFSLDAIVAEVKTAIKPSTPRGGRPRGGPKSTFTPRSQSPKAV